MQRKLILQAAMLLMVFYGFSQKPPSLLNRVLSIEVEEEPLANTLKRIEELGGFRFAYSNQDIDLSRDITLKEDSTQLIDILRQIFPAEDISFRERGNKVLIVKAPVVKIYQTVRGTIIDHETKQPIPGANVIIMGIEPLTGASTDLYGRFKIEKVPVGRQSIRATFSGYKPYLQQNILVDAGKESVINITLSESVTELETIVVIAELDKARPLNDMAMVSAKSFTVEETSRYAGSFNDPARMATSYAGVVSAQDDTDNGIIIRGNSPRGLLWRLEGLELPNPNHFASDGASSGAISMLNSNVLTNSDFLTGAFPAEYGNAFSGVFDLKLRNGNDEKREYAVQAGLLGIDASFEGPIRRASSDLPNASYLLNYRYSTISLLEDLGLNIASDGVSVPAYQDLAFKLNLPTKNSGTFSFYGLGGTSKTDEVFDSESNGQIFSLKETEEYALGLAGLSHVINLNPKSYLETSASYSITQYDFFLEGVENQQVFDEDIEDYRNENVRLATTYKTKFNAKHSTKIGAIYTDFAFNLNSLGRELDGTLRYRSNESGNFGMFQSFISHKYNLSNQLSFTGGIHYIRLDLAGQDNIEPRLGMTWQFTENQALSFGFGVHSRKEETSLYFTELFRSNLSTIQPNKNLGLAKARHFVLGYDRDIAGNFHLKVEAYYQDLYDIPVSADPSSRYSSLNQENAFQREPLVNEGRGRNYGVELTFEKFLSDGYFFLSTASLYNSEFKTLTGTWHDTRYNGNYNFNLVGGKEFVLGSGSKQKTLSLGLETVLGGGARATDIDLTSSVNQGETVFFQDRPFARQLEDYARIDFQVALRTNKKGLTHEWKIDIQNLTSRSNVIGERYSSVENRIVPAAFSGEIIPVLSYKLTF
ncbi:TonB-dependent receptor [Roseivirga sp. E12]|uniref:TonB-dependent receptor n=1 Tax=Roseivirga sp. E12 TaxID=2819237 RepID=UPI001ABC4A41|nr:TonB-dependent receptor [Roseivirga sp. E12]MBO3698696.1 TonB-dependent receptor [Roseivirga sp. E12]